MFQNKHDFKLGYKGICLCAMTLVLGSAFASKNMIQDRKITFKEAQALALKASQESAFPIEVNEEILKELNRFVGTQSGRKYFQESLERMEDHKSMILGALKKYRMPEELLAVPLIESGYQNIRQDSNLSHGAGIWMFIKSTARNYGLKVNDEIDERLNPKKESDAAMRLLGADFLQLQDWRLALLAYNAGENSVSEAIQKFSTQNPWELLARGLRTDSHYLPKVMAAVLIMKNPSLLD